MKRELLHEIIPILEQIDNHLLEIQKKYGEVYHEDKEYIIFRRPEEDSYADGTRFTSYDVFCIEDIEVEEKYTGVDSIEDIEFVIPQYIIIEDEFGNTELGRDGFCYWYNGRICDFVRGEMRKVA